MPKVPSSVQYENLCAIVFFECLVGLVCVLLVYKKDFC